MEELLANGPQVVGARLDQRPQRRLPQGEVGLVAQGQPADLVEGPAVAVAVLGCLTLDDPTGETVVELPLGD